MDKFVYSFNEGSKDMRTLLGVKGANLAEMTNMGLPVPFGFTITTEACKEYLSDGTLRDEVVGEILQHIADLEEVMNKNYGDPENPLLVSVRSGAPVSMPGIMITILNLGLNDATVEGLASKSGDRAFAYDCYQRLIRSYGIQVYGIDQCLFDKALQSICGACEESYDTMLDEKTLKSLIAAYKDIFIKELDIEFPQDLHEQLRESVIAVFKSWNSEAAINYRLENGISDALATAVNVQSMVFGNFNEKSCAGIATTRNPETGENVIVGEYLEKGQGRDINTHTKHTYPLSQMAENFPDAYKRFEKIAKTLEKHFKDMLNLEFVVEDGKLFMLHTRVAKRTPEAAVKIAVDLVKDEIIDRETAVMRIDPSQIEQLLPPPGDGVSEITGYTAKILAWADYAKTLKVRTNADNPEEVAQARAFGAEGIGLIRTEHMFFDSERIPKMRRMVLADSEDERRKALAELMPYQKEDFKRIYKEMGDMPVTIRLLDPPLHEFLPANEDEISSAAEELGISFEQVISKTRKLKEFNPMLGRRGARLAIAYPEVVRMQTEAIISAAIEVRREESIDIMPEIMVPFIAHVNELATVKRTINELADRLIAESEEDMKYLVGTMIEVPRAAMTADELAEEAEFFSFGTNDLTMMGFGLSRLDKEDIIKEYLSKGILEYDPFKTLDIEGVGSLMKMAVEGGKKTRANIKLGICGEHGGDPATVQFCHDLGLNYVSCSPYKVPIARLVAAQAAIAAKGSN